MPTMNLSVLIELHKVQCYLIGNDKFVSFCEVLKKTINTDSVHHSVKTVNLLCIKQIFRQIRIGHCILMNQN
jgi:hypothetical protein